MLSNQGIKVLSYFDGISCGRVALEKAGIPVSCYHATEIDKYAIKVSMKNYPDILHLGDVMDLDLEQLPDYDLLIGGSPCTFWSIAKRNREVDKTGIGWKLFMKYKEAQSRAKYFLYENVASMPSQIKDFISEELGVDPILIDSSLVSAQQRKRLYWTNIPNVQQPEDRYIYLQDIILDDTIPVALSNIYGGFKEKSVRVHENKSPTLRTAAGGGHIPSLIKKSLIHSQKAIDYMDRKVSDGRTHWDFGFHSDINNKKSATLVANLFKGVPYNVIKDWDCIRKFHPVECERLQGLPDGYTEGVSDTQRYKMIGNGWEINTITHILSYL